MKRELSAFLMAVICMAASTLPVSAAVPIRTVALSGQHAPGTANGVKFKGFGSATSNAVIDGKGRVAFYGRVSGTSIFVDLNDLGIWSEGPSLPGLPILSLIARAGDDAPDTEDDTLYSTISDPNLDLSGHMAFRASLSVVGATDNGIWSDRDGTTDLVVRAGSHAPGTPADVTFSIINSPATNASGHVAFLGKLTGLSVVGGETDLGFWSEGGPGAPTLALVARSGDVAPDTDMSTLFETFGAFEMNAAGRLAFISGLTGGNVTSNNDQGIWSDFSGALHLVVREGATAPSAGAGIVFAGFDWFGFNDAAAASDVAHIAFHAFLINSQVPNVIIGQGIWKLRDGSIVHIAHTGGNPPGTDAGVLFNTFDRLSFNGAGSTAFVATLISGGSVTSANNQGIWSDGSGVYNLLARSGDSAPGIAGGVNFASFGNLVLNNGGRTAFIANLTGAGVDSTNNQGIWAQDSTDELKLLVRTGDTLVVSAGDSRTISSLLFGASIQNQQDGRGSSFSDSDQLAFVAIFTDGSKGVFMTIGPDKEGDGVGDPIDNCPNVANSDQTDTDGDGLGDLCDSCKLAANPGAAQTTDTDGDGVPDACDNCPCTRNPGQEDNDGNGRGFACDDDDGVCTINCGPIPTCMTGFALPMLLFLRVRYPRLSKRSWSKLGC